MYNMYKHVLLLNLVHKTVFLVLIMIPYTN